MCFQWIFRVYFLYIDWFDLLSVQGTLRSLLQHHNSKASIFQHSAFFMTQFSHLYMTIGRTIVSTIHTCAGKVMSLLFNTLSRFIIAFLQRSKCLLISWLHSSFAVILEPKKIKSMTASTFSPSICHKVMGPCAIILVFLMLSFHSPLSLSSRDFLPVEWYHLHIWEVFLMFLQSILIPACDSSSPGFSMMHCAYKLNKQGDNTQPCCTPFPILNQSVIPCPVSTVASWLAYRFLRRPVRWYGIPISWRIFHSLLWSTQSKALAQSMKEK